MKMITGRLKQTSSSYAARLQFTWVLLVAGIASSLFLVRPKYALQPEE